jgi:hypothetical protein
VSSPANGATLPAGQLVQVTATASSSHPITGWHAYANNQNVATGTAGNSFSAQLSLAAGAYTIVVKAWDSSGAVGQQTVKISVTTGSPPPPPPPSTPFVTITSPASGATVASPVVISATFSNGGTAQYMKVWVDGSAKFTANNVTSIKTPGIALSSGSHKATVQAYTGTLYSASETINVP